METQKEKKPARYRELTGLSRWIFYFFTASAIMVSIIQIFHIVIAGQVLQSKAYLGVLMAVLVPLVFLIFPATKNAPRDRIPWYDWVAALLMCICAVYISIHAIDIQLKGWSIRPPAIAFYLGIIAWILIVDAVRRTTGNALAIIVLFMSAYPLAAEYMPGILCAKSYSLQRLVGFHYLSSQSMFGVTTHVFGRLVIAFLLFAVTLLVLGGGDFFIKLALSLLGNVRGGGAKVSILGSAIFASISGSPTSNVITTGSFTIPAMKKSGYPAHYAAALEACSSTGGVLMPPIMGVTAFIMADFLQTSYATVCIAAIIPSLLYFFSLYMQSDLFAARSGLKGLPKDQCPPFGPTVREGWPYIVTFICLIYFLFFLRQEARAPYYSIVVLFCLMLIFRRKHLSRDRIKQFIQSSGRVLCEIMTIMIGVGMVIGAFLLTGVAQSFSSSLLQMAGGNLLLLLITGALASFVLGIGMTMIPCYIILALLLAPALVEIGIQPVAAHLFILYWGMISFITPPVAIASIVAAGLAETNNMKTGVHSLRLGFVAYLIPFFFVYNPALVGIGTKAAILYSIMMSILGIILISGSAEGYLFLLGRLGWIQRVICGILGFAVFIPVKGINFIGCILLILFIAGTFLLKKLHAPHGGIQESAQ
ncbi:TRAP transporter permease [Thermodesulfobacteriota bacterium]